ncbi:MAG: hypothetical protein CM15mP83_1460 [Flavobacteriaceae bacterium]|nr:MAG: hypothetical protein CM15mP83_1460 [Flavobacteriaceae bacterium]
MMCRGTFGIFLQKGFIDMSEDCGFVVEKTYPLVFDAYYVSFISEKTNNLVLLG